MVLASMIKLILIKTLICIAYIAANLTQMDFANASIVVNRYCGNKARYQKCIESQTNRKKKNRLPPFNCL